MEIDSQRRGKCKKLLALASYLETDLEKIVNSYGSSCFLHTEISKKEFFSSFLNGQISDAEGAQIADKCRLDFHRDMRSSLNYALDLILGWLVEDLILNKMKALGSSIELDGADKSREFLKSYEITVESDFVIDGINGPQSIELVVSWDDYWKNTNSLDLRSSKYEKLLKSKLDVRILAIDVSSQEGMVLTTTDIQSKIRRRNNPAWGGKLVYTFLGINDYRKPLSESLVLLK
jgi:hypothetical protein